MRFGRHFERIETRIETRNDDNNNSKNDDWQDSIDLPDDIGGWINEIELPDDNDDWQDSIDLGDESYAEILESYLIPAEEGLLNKSDDKEVTEEIREIFKKVGGPVGLRSTNYCRLSELIEDCDNPEKFTTTDLKKIHKCFYDEQEAIDFFAPSPTRDELTLIKKYQPVPIHANGMGDYYCLTTNLEVKEYIHDATNYFDAPYARDYKSFREWLEKFYKKHAEK